VLVAAVVIEQRGRWGSAAKHAPAGPHTRAADAVAGREAEFGEEWYRHGEIRPPDPASLTPVQELLEPARATLTCVREAVSKPEWANDGETRAALREARTLIDGRPARPTK
jgi:hypothetical protein